VADLPLAGTRISVTRPRAQAAPLARALAALGADVSVVPLVEIAPPADRGPLDRALARIADYDWLVFTSANAVQALGDRLRAAGRARTAAVGPATAAALQAHGLEPQFVPERHAAEEVAAGLEPVNGLRVFLPQADLAGTGLAEELRRRGGRVDAVTAYRTVQATPPPSEVAELRSADAIVLASASAARSLAAQGGPGGALVVCIGPGTAAVAREVGFSVGLVADEASADGLVRALVAHFGEQTA